MSAGRPTARSCLVTGSASGIGHATARRLRDDNWNVVGVDLDDADVVADLASPAGRSATVEAADSAGRGSLDAAILCAGVWEASPRCLSVNYFATVALLEALRPLLARGHDGRAVVVSSIAAIWPSWPEVVDACLSGDEEAALSRADALRAASGEDRSYRSSKLALLRWMRRAAPAWGGSGILLNAVAPGTIETAMSAALWGSPGARAATLERVPTVLGRLGRPDEVAEVLRFLAGPSNSLLVGQVLFVDGGSEALERGDAAW